MEFCKKVVFIAAVLFEAPSLRSYRSGVYPSSPIDASETLLRVTLGYPAAAGYGGGCVGPAAEFG